MRSRLPAVVATALVLHLLFPIPARALQIVSQSINYLPGTQNFEFAFTLDASPDFFTVDEFGRAKDAFQYWITWDLHIPDPFYPNINPNVLVRSPNASIPGQLALCNGDHVDPYGPACSTWGALRGTVPYQLNGTTVTFSVPRVLLGDSDGIVSYYFGVFRYGGTTDSRMGVSGGPTSARPATWGRIKLIYR